MNFGNLWVVDLIGNLGVDELVDTCVGVVVESIFGNKPLGGSYKKRHCHKPWFGVDCYITKHGFKLWLKVNHNSHATKHKENILKNLLKRKRFFWKLQELNICVHLPRWTCFHFGKSTNQRHPFWTRLVWLRFWKVFASWLASLHHPCSCELIIRLR